ncbi:MAG: 1,3-beta-glucanosyltransferase gas1 [Geoglossum umbratile]|nr:MAG: 1,3-beta-glucanosyltransferase gas1 [Geoglossum umbratile]
MKGYAFASAIVASLSLLSTVAADVDPIVIKGSKFFYKTNGTEFFMRGVAYQQDIPGNGSDSTQTQFTDPLADADACKRDVPILQQLMTNTIRVYAIDPKKDHSACMTLLQNAGIYVISDLSQPGESINRDNPIWNDGLYNRYTSVIDELQKYSNVLGFFAGNEVSNNVSNTDASPFVKAAVRDMKAYIKRKGYRPIGVGYATNDDADIRQGLADYFNCGKTEESIDFWGYNIYSWCGNSSYSLSGYDVRTKDFENYSVPVFFAEYGCNVPSPRLFTEVEALYGDDMSKVWSGGIVYMYFQEANQYGLVTVSGNSASKLPDFTALSNQIASATPTGVNANSYTPTNTVARSCPAKNSAWSAATQLPPTPNQELCSCMVKSLNCAAKAGVQDSAFGTLFGSACATKGVCDGIQADGSSGVYGAYSMCSPLEQLSWVFNEYYSANNKNPQACNFAGNATIQTPQTPPSNCQALLSQAGPAGTGIVTSTPSGTGSSGSSSSKKSAAGLTTVPQFNFGVLTLGFYGLGAILTGAAMVIL